MIDHEIFRRSELLVQDVIAVIDGPAYDTFARLVLSGNLCQISVEHSCAFRMLVEGRMLASSFVVLRAQFESVLRAVWTFYTATDNEISRIAAKLNIETEQGAEKLPQVPRCCRYLRLRLEPNFHLVRSRN